MIYRDYFIGYKNLLYLKKKIIMNFGKKLNFRDCIVKSLAHGKIFYNFFYLTCRFSFYLLKGFKINGFGKGVLSRSEPLFYHPNPCFNSIGRGARENFLFKIKKKKNWLYELIKLNFIECFFLFKKKIIKLNGILKKKHIEKILFKINPYFFWIFKIFKKFKKNYFNFKSGIKYGGNHLIYQKKCENDFHQHSSSIIYIGNSHLTEKFCKICSFENIEDWKNFQNRVRLGQHVSKKIIFIDFKKKQKKSWILLEWNFGRWASF
jgi:hypothetical protein